MAAQNSHVGSDDVILSLCAGANLTSGQIVFSHDSRFFFCCSGSAVKVYNTTNGQCAQVLHAHKAVVTGLALNPSNKLQLFSCGLDGLINQWAYNEGVLLRTYKFYMPLHCIVCVDTAGGFVTAVAQRPQASHCCLLRLRLKKERHSETSTSPTPQRDIVLHSCQADHRTIASGCSDQYIAAVQGHELSVYSCKKKTCRKLTTDAKNPFTCVACHPTDCCIVTGHANGKITFWWNFSGKEKTVISSNHWHSLPVQCLAFSPEGSFLLSGGHECVLVRWKMDSEYKDFLPRLGAPIYSIASCPLGTLFITSHTDNVLQVISSNMDVMHAVRGLARAHLGMNTSGQVPVGLLCDPRSRALVTNGRPGHLQFYCMDTDTQLYNLDIVGHNYISPENLKKPAVVTEVEQAAFDSTGEWLATFQKWEDGDLIPMYCLKFWNYNKKQQNYHLNTTVELPHYKVVRCLQFRPQGTPETSESYKPAMVSAGDDGFFKLWSLTTENLPGKTVKRWTCDAVGHYRQKPARIARFSHDGTSLAVAFDSLLTFWDPDTNVMAERLSFGDQPILCMEFGGKTSTNCLVLTTSSHLTVLDLASYSVSMQISLPSAILTTDGDLMCAVSAQQDLYVFRPSEEKPVFYRKRVMENPVVSAIFLPQSTMEEEEEVEVSWQSQSHLYLMDNRQRLFTPRLQAALETQTPSSRAQILLQQVGPPKTALQVLLSSGHSQHESVSTTPTAADRNYTPQAILDVMNTPLNTMSCFHFVSQHFMDSLLTKRKGLEEPMEVDQDDEGE